MLREKGEPGFPEDVLIARPLLPGARIVALPDAPEPKAPAKKKTAKAKAKPKRKPAKRKAASKAKTARPIKATAKKTKSAATAKAKVPKTVKPALQALPPTAAAIVPEPQPVPQPTPELQSVNAPTSQSLAIDDRTPIVILPRNRALTPQGQGVVARLITWLGKLLPRKRRRASLPRARQALGPANLHK